jgi:predicted Zn finger-like uncharacterized protein
MIVSCPSCTTRYLIDPTALGGEGRRVRCAKCNHIWHERPPADMPKRVDVLPPDDEPKAIPFGSNLPAVVARRRRANRLGWLAVAAAVIIIIVAGLLARGAIVDAWPPAGKLYSAIGLGSEKPDTSGLAFRDVAYEQIFEGEVPILVIRGSVFNEGDHDREVPPIRIALLDAAGTELHYWTFAADNSELEAGGGTTFETRLTSPPQEAVSVDIDFAGGETH